jgi:flagellar motor switch protein FliN/FliY
MSDILSQEEIDALLRGQQSPSQSSDDAILTDIEKDALGEIGNISMRTAATTLSTLLRNKVVITTPRVDITTMNELGKEYPIPFVAVEVKYTQGLEGVNLLILKEEDVKLITDLMMGGDGSNIADEISDLHLSAIGEAMNQMVGSSATSLSTMFDKNINISPPKAFVINFTDESPYDAFDSNEPLVRIAFSMEIGTLLKSEMMQLLPIDFAKELVNNLLGGAEKAPDNEPLQKQKVTQTPPIEPEKPEIKQTVVDKTESEKVVKAQPVVFQQLNDEAPEALQGSNMDIIMDIPLQVTVELGRTKKTVKDILELGTGSVIELDRLAGEPIDILVNGKLVARGEVIVIDENFGVRIIEMIDQTTAKNTK